jgi:hypothetical protein
MTKSISKNHWFASSDVPIAHVIIEWPGGLEQPAVIYPIGTWQYADDDGVFIVDMKTLRIQLFPDQTFPLESPWQELVDHDFFRFGKIGGRIVAQIRQFKRHQRINRPTPRKLLPLDDEQPPPEFFDDGGVR